MPRQFDVGVDVHGFAPVTLAQLLSPAADRHPKINE
jgi:calcineurin-like phosphoesterase family protein